MNFHYECHQCRTMKQSISLLQANEVFSAYSTEDDFTGVHIVAHKPVAVYGGCECIDRLANSSYTNHAAMEQVSIPVEYCLL